MSRQFTTPIRWAVTLLCVIGLSTAASAIVVPEPVPDRGPLLSEPMRRGGLVRHDTAATPGAPKTIDGDASDWVGESSRIGGTSRFDRGEHVYADFIHDAWGADDGTDAERLALTGALAEAEARTTRVDGLFQALGAQFGAPDPAGADEAYGDALANDVADIAEVRWATTTDDSVDVLVPITNLTDPAALGVLLLLDTDPDATHDGGATVDVAGLRTVGFDHAVLLTNGAASLTDLATGASVAVDGATSVVNADGWTNVLEARLPRAVVAPDGSLRVAVVSGRWDGTGLVPANVAYRDAEPVAGMYNDQQQAMALLDGVVDPFSVTIDLADLDAGRTESVHPGPGYHERTFTSDEGISTEFRQDLDDVYEDTVWQRYALFVPTSHEVSTPTPLTFWMHYRGGKSHSGGAWSPRLFTQLGEESDTIVVSPHGRGERRWYEGSSHQDFWEVFDDVHALFPIDPQRRYVSGYSMGGHGSPMMAFLYPDTFAAAYLQAGAIGGNLFDVAVNSRHTPMWMDVSAQDALVVVNQQMGEELNSLGYRYVANTFVAGEHYTQAILDEWAGGARYLRQHATPLNPRHVTYRVVPSLIETINDGRGEPTSVHFNPDGAWWVDDIVVADGAEHGTVDAVAHTLPGEEVTPFPDLGDIQPGDYSVASVRHGQTWLTEPATVEPVVHVDLTGVASATLDAGRWNLSTAGATEVHVTTDHAAALMLANVPTGLRVTVNGAVAPGGAVDVPAGGGVVVIAPA